MRRGVGWVKRQDKKNTEQNPRKRKKEEKTVSKKKKKIWKRKERNLEFNIQHMTK